MAVVTRSTTRKSRSQTANPDYKVKLAPRASPKAAPKATSKVAPKAVIKAAPKAAKKADFKAPMKTALKVPRKPSKCKGRKADVVTPEDIAAREAKEAETAERVRRDWEAIVAKRPPCKQLARSDFPSPDHPDPPHRLYGWKFESSYMILLARRRRLTFPLHGDIRHLFKDHDGDTFNFGDLTEEHLNDGPLRQYLQLIARMRVLGYFARNTGAVLTIERPIALDTSWMLVLWNNYNAADKFASFQALNNWEQSKTFLNEAMNECLPYDSEPSELLWWWSFENDWRD